LDPRSVIALRPPLLPLGPNCCARPSTAGHPPPGWGPSQYSRRQRGSVPRKRSIQPVARRPSRSLRPFGGCSSLQPGTFQPQPAAAPQRAGAPAVPGGHLSLRRRVEPGRRRLRRHGPARPAFEPLARGQGRLHQRASTKSGPHQQGIALGQVTPTPRPRFSRDQHLTLGSSGRCILKGPPASPPLRGPAPGHSFHSGFRSRLPF